MSSAARAGLGCTERFITKLRESLLITRHRGRRGLLWEASVQRIVCAMRRLLSMLVPCLAVTACGEAAFGSDESVVVAGERTRDGSDGPAEQEQRAEPDPMRTLVELIEANEVTIAEPAPLLPQAARDHLVSALSAPDFSALCEPYLENAVNAADNAVGLCALRGLSAAENADARGVEDYRSACRDARVSCEAEAVERSARAQQAACRERSSCDATVGEVDQCNASLVMLDLAILMPAATWPIPECDALSPELGRSLEAEVRGALLQTYRELDLHSVVEACAPVHSRCASIAVPLPVSGG